MKTANDILRQIEMNLLKGRKEKLSEKLIIDYTKQKCKEQIQKCRNIYSANRHKSPQEIKEKILKSLITEFE